jgi:hypothetical protein
MRCSHPPTVATWFLEHMRSGRENECLVGDLMEDYGRGRSNAWYWKQVLAAIVTSFYQEVRTNYLLAIKAIITGWITQSLFQFVAWGLLSRFPLRLPIYHELPLILGYVVQASLTWLIVWTPIWVGSGWFVGRLYRTHLAGMVLVFSTSVLVWRLQRLPWTIHLIFNAVGNPRYFPQLVVELMNLILPSACVVLGGLISSRSRPDYLAS